MRNPDRRSGHPIVPDGSEPSDAPRCPWYWRKSPPCSEDGGIRTRDLRIKSPLLYRLSYILRLNLRRHDITRRNDTELAVDGKAYIVARPAEPWYWKARKVWDVCHKAGRVLLGPQRNAALRQYHEMIMAKPDHERQPVPVGSSAAAALPGASRQCAARGGLGQRR